MKYLKAENIFNSPSSWPWTDLSHHYAQAQEHEVNKCVFPVYFIKKHYVIAINAKEYKLLGKYYSQDKRYTALWQFEMQRILNNCIGKAILTPCVLGSIMEKMEQWNYSFSKTRMRAWVPLQLPGQAQRMWHTLQGKKARSLGTNTYYSTLSFPKSLMNIFPYAARAKLFRICPILSTTSGFPKIEKLRIWVEMEENISARPTNINLQL